MLFRNLWLCFFFASVVHASSSSPFPRGCETTGFGFQSPIALLNDTGNPSFFLIQNNTTIAIELRRIAPENTFMVPRLEARLEPGQWAAFASDISNTYLRCATKNPDDTLTTIDCRQVLSICQYPRVRYALSNTGTYWVSTNKPLTQVIQDATRKGIYLKW